MELKTYRVSWHIELDATSPEAAAEMAREIQQDPDNIATVFEVREGDEHSAPVRVDLAGEP